MSLLYWTLCVIVTMMMLLKHPLSLVLLLISTTLLFLLLLMNVANSSWLVMIMFLVFLGGLLVIFTYLSALVPNEVYLFNIQWIALMMSPSMYAFTTTESFSQATPLVLIFQLNDYTAVHLFLSYLLTALMVTMMMAQQMKSPLSQTNY